MPSRDCVASVVSRPTPKAFGECFRSWTQAVATVTGGEVIAVDDKSAPGSRDRRRGRSAAHRLQESVTDFFAVATAADFAGVPHDFHKEIDKDHGRLEVRRYWVSEDLRMLPDYPLWAGLRSIGIVERHFIIGTTETVERRYFTNSAPAQGKCFANAVRGHWALENCLH